MTKDWHISHGKDGFKVHLVEKSRWGVFLTWLTEVTCMEWFGRYKNFPFCWINPYSWTFHLGTKNKNLGTLWLGVGNWVLDIAWKAEKEKQIFVVPIANEQVKKHFPETYTWFEGWVDVNVPASGDEPRGETGSLHCDN